MENQIKKTLLGGVAQKIKLRHPLFCFKNFVILVFLNQLEFTYGSIVLANTRPNTYQYSVNQF